MTPRDVRAQVKRMTAEERAEVSPEWLAQAYAATTVDPWTLGFAMVHRATNEPVGTCGFKGPPEPDGIVEIAYGVVPDHQGKGYATEAAEALVDYAFSSDQVRVVRAHTLLQSNASTRVLVKCGFKLIGEVIEPEDGLVWRWERRSPDEHAQMMHIEGIEHIQLAMPAGQEDVARRFYSGLLGIPEVAKPLELQKRGGAWFENGRLKVHLGVDPDFRPARKAHPGLLVRDLRTLVRKLRAAGIQVTEDGSLSGFDRVYIADPFGNRIELLEPFHPKIRDGEEIAGQDA